MYTLDQLTPGPYAVTMTKKNRGISFFDIAVSDSRGTIHSWEAHWETPIRIHNNHLFYAEYGVTGPGGRIVAIDLRQRKVAWRSELQGLGRGPHFIYGNRISIDVDSTGRDLIYIFGDESAGRYVEAKLIATGETVAHRRVEAAGPTRPSPMPGPPLPQR